MLAQQIVSGLATGSLYALTAIGIVLIFRNTRTINLAQGDFSMMGAFVAPVVLEHSRGSLIVATLVTIVAITALASVGELLIMRSIVLLTWAVGGMLAAVSGILLGPLVYVSTQMMDGVLVKGYVGAVFGGLYSLPGAVIGSLIIGVAENLAGGYLGAQYKVTIAFVLIVLVLALKPRGLFGGKARREI